MIVANKELMKVIIITLPQLLTKNKNIVKIVKNIFGDIDTSKLIDREEIALIEMIKKACSATMVDIKNKEMYIKYIGDRKHSKVMDEITSRVLNEEYNDAFLNDIMKYLGSLSFNKPLLANREALIEGLTSYSLDGIVEGINSLKKVREALDNVYSDIQKNDLSNDDKELMVDGDETVGLEETVNDLKVEEKFRLFTGGATDIIFGGYAPNRAYCDSAISGGFKSGFLLNECCAIKDNINNKIPDEVLQGLKPVIVLYILENTLIQTYRRILAYLGFKKEDVDAMSQEELTSIGFRYLQPNGNNIRFLIKQLPSGVLDKTYMINYDKDLRKRGYKVILHAVDYIDKMGVNLSSSDLAGKTIPIVKSSSDLKAVSIATFAPVLTSAQFNRQAIMAIEDSFKAGQLDPIKRLHLGYIASGYAMVCEFDGFLIHYKGKIGDTKFISYKSAKARDGEDNGKQIVVSKFADNGFKIEKETVDAVEDLFADVNDINSIIADVNNSLNSVGNLYMDTLGEDNEPKDILKE